MSINELTSIVAPPLEPSEAPVSAAWLPVESRLGVALPHDYKKLIEIYGSGRINEFLWVFNPFSANNNINLERQVDTQAQVMAEVRSGGEVVPFESFPRVDGILPFGITDNGDVLYWRTFGNSDEWTVVVSESRTPEWESFDLSASAFLVNIIKRKIVCKFFPLSFSELPASFETADALEASQ